MLPLLLLAAQIAPAASPPARFSILQDCPKPVGEEVVVCGRADAPRLPLPDERGPPDRPMPSNPNVDGKGALAAEATPCAATQWGCQVGVDVIGASVAAIRLVGKLLDPDSCCEPGQATSPVALVGDVAGGVKRAFAKKPDKSNRVAIPLGPMPAPSLVGRLSP